MIPARTGRCPGSTMRVPDMASDAVAVRYAALFADIPWDILPDSRGDRPRPGPRPLSPAIIGKALVVKIAERLPSGKALATFLLAHPALVVVLGIPLVPNPHAPDGIDWPRTVRGERRWRTYLQQVDLAALDVLLRQSVAAVQTIVPTLGQVIAIDATHLLAHVRENNPNQPRHPTKPSVQPRGDPDCRLGVKVRSNQHPSAKRKQYYYGYSCGISATIVTVGEHRHDLVLATHTVPANTQDIRHFGPLYTQSVATLGHRPQHLAADAAFDAWSVYDPALRDGGIAAIASNPRHPAPRRDPEGRPICDQQRPMRPVGSERREKGHRIQAYACPLLGPDHPTITCADPRFAHGGCSKRINIEPGGRDRATIDRTSPLYQTVYAQRTCVERTNSHAKALGLNQLVGRSLASVSRQVMATALTINLLARERIRADLSNNSPP